MIDKRKKGHGARPHLKTVTYHADAVASHTECVVVVWAQIKFVSPLWQKLKLESTSLEILDIFGSNFPPHPAKFLILHSLIPYSLGMDHCQIPEGLGGGGGGMLTLRVVRCILQTLNTVKGLHNYHKFYQHLPAYYTKRRVYSGHLNLPIRQLEREKDLNYFM